MTIVGIDPGINGGIAKLTTSGLETVRMPAIKGKGKGEILFHEVRQQLIDWAPDHVVIEEQFSVKEQGHQSTFKTGTNFGILIGICVGLNLPYTIVSARRWKMRVSCPSNKRLARKRASEVFPENAGDWRLVCEDGKAEAALIAYYGKLTLARD